MQEFIPWLDASQGVKPVMGDWSNDSSNDPSQGKIKEFVHKRPGLCVALALTGGVILGCLFKKPMS